MLHLNGYGDVHSSCLERWTKVKQLTVLMRTRTSNLLVSRSDVLPLGQRDSTMSYAILRTIVVASYIQLHMRIRTRRDGKNIFKSLCRSQNLPRLFEEVNQLYKERYAALTHGNFKKNPIPQLPCKRRRILVYQLM